MANYVLNAADLEYLNRRNDNTAAVYKGQTNYQEPKNDTNVGGLAGGIGFLGQKIGLGALQGIEGIVDYTAGGLAKLFGNDEYAEQLFSSDWTNYNAADEWFNPEGGWKVAGDVAGGIGSSVPGMAGAALGAAIIVGSGGTLSAVGSKIIVGSISATIAGLGAAGTSTKEAYNESGQLTGKEFGYGALSGATEAGVEFATAGLAKGSGRIVSSIGKAAAKESAEATAKSVAKTVTKTGAKQFFKNIGEDFVTEAIEEGFSEYISPYYQRMTYNPDAELASPDEIAYAALIGGLSGVAMSGGSSAIGSGINSVKNYTSGNTAVEKGTAYTQIEMARQLSEKADANETNAEVKNVYDKLIESLKKTNGVSSDSELTAMLQNKTAQFKAKDKMLLGAVKNANVISTFDPYISHGARAMIMDAYNVAQKYSAFGIKDANGNALNITAEDLTKGLSKNLIEKAKSGTLTNKEARILNTELAKALRENTVLATLAASEATGSLMVNTKKMAESVLRGGASLNANDLNTLIEQGKQPEIKALMDLLGVQNIETLTADELNYRLAQFRDSGNAEVYIDQVSRIKEAIKHAGDEAKPLPKVIGKNKKDGVYRYKKDGVDLAIFKKGDLFYVYDYTEGDLSFQMSLNEVNKLLSRLWKGEETASNRTESAEGIDTYAKENIDGYNELNEPNKAAVRMTIRQAKAYNLTDSQIKLYGTVVAKSGLNVVFDNTIGDGLLLGNTIYANPRISETRTYEMLLGHEMFHKIFASGTKKAFKLYKEAKKFLSKDAAKRIEDEYTAFYKKHNATADNALIEEEIAAAGSEEVFKTEAAWEYILGEEPTLGDKVLSFFRKSARDYSSIQGMSAQARKFLRQYKKLFDKIVETNRTSNAFAFAMEGTSAKTPGGKLDVDSVKIPSQNKKYAIKYPKFSEKQITQNIEALADMQFVASIDASKLEKTGKAPTIIFDEYFNSLENNIASETFGDIALPKSSIKSEIRHGITAEKIASIEAIPAVIEQGKVIFHKTKTGTDVDRIVIAAPIKIGQVDYYMGVMLQRDTQNQRLYLHNVVAIKKEVTTLSQDNSLTNWSDEKNSRLFITNILQNAINVKIGKQKNAKNIFKGRLALPTDKSYLDAVEKGNMETAQRMVDEAAQKSMSNSLVKDKNGNLLTVYHGSPSKFTVFEHNRMNVHGNAHGRGFYFTENKNLAESYEREGGQLLKGYLNIEKPLSEEKVTIKKTELVKLIKATCEEQAKSLVADEGYGSVKEALPDTWISNYVMTYGMNINDAYKEVANIVYSSADSDVDIIAELTNAGAGRGNTLTLTRDILGFDGVIYTNPDGNHEFVVLTSNQFKSADPVTYDDNGNVIPLSKRFNPLNKDIRFALSKDVDNYTEEQYNNFGWAREADAITYNELNDFYSAIKTKRSLDQYPRSLRGEYIVEVNNKPDTTLDVNNIFVFFKGTKNDPEITRVIRADIFSNTEMEEYRDVVYGREKGIASAVSSYDYYEANGVLREYTRKSVSDFNQYLQTAREKQGGRSKSQSGGVYGAGTKGRGTNKSTTSTYLKVVHTFTDITGKKRNVIKINDKFMIEGDSRSDYQPTIEAAVNAENNRIIERYAKKKDKTKTFVKAKLAVDKDFLKGFRWALPRGEASTLTNDIAYGSVERVKRPTMKEKAEAVVSGTIPSITATEIQLTNAQAGIEYAGRKLGMDNIESLVQRVRASRSMAQEMIGGNQYEILPGQTLNEVKHLGEGLEPILSEIRDRRKGETKEAANERYTAYQYYLYHKHNVDRMSLKEKTKESEKPEDNKPVLRKLNDKDEYVPVTAEESLKAIEEYEKQYPEFKRNSEKVYGFLNRLLELQVKYGLITEELYTQLREKYPHYVPTFRVENKMGTAPIRGKGNIEVAQTVKKATGSIETLDDLELSIFRMVEKVIRAGNVNILANSLIDAANGDTRFIKEVSREKTKENLFENEDNKETPKKNQITVYRNGEKITLAVTPEVFAGFDDFNSKDDAAILPIRAVSAMTNGFKVLVTSANPIFLVRNMIRDLQDAGINTRYAKAFVKNYARAIYHLSHNTELAQIYRAAGGFNASIFDYARGFTGKQSKMGFTNSTKKMRWVLNKIENANMFIEQLPRFAEFISSVESGKSVDQAILDAADVTTNFGRSGKLTRKLNQTIIPFLNPAVQGLSKIYRNFKDAFRSRKAFTELLIKCVILGIIPMAFNNLLYSDDEEYEDIKDTDKENNYLFKVGSTWIKIPKGRFVSVLAGLANRTETEIEGGDADWKEYMDNVISQVTPVENFTRPIWSPITDVNNNKTWYGSAIEGMQFENKRPSERYDESTSSIAIAIGKAINYSPKKIHYLLDQYSGVIGDFVLPATTQKAEKSFVASSFVFDPVVSNRLSDDFYKLYEEAQYNKSDRDITAKYQLKYLNEVKTAVSKMYDEISEIQKSDLTTAEKLQQTRVIRMLINNAYKTAKTDYDTYTEAVKATDGLYDETKESGVRLRYTDITHKVYGAAKAFEVYNDDIAEKMKIINSCGIDYEKLYYYYFATRDLEADYDKDGNTVSGSKRKKVLDYINSLNVSADHKLMLLAIKGYSPQDGDIKGVSAETAKKRLVRFILNLKGKTKQEKIEIAEICGLKVKNGAIVIK